MPKRDKQVHKVSRLSQANETGETTPQHEQIAQHAYDLWQRRGRPLGSPDEDWTQAEADLQHAHERRV